MHTKKVSGLLFLVTAIVQLCSYNPSRASFHTLFLFLIPPTPSLLPPPPQKNLPLRSSMRWTLEGGGPGFGFGHLLSRPRSRQALLKR